MKVWEEILQRLRNGELAEVVRRDYRSDSQFAKAIRIYDDEMSSKAEEIRDALLSKEQNLIEAENRNKRISAENSEIEKEVQNLRVEKEALLAEVQEAKEVYDRVRVDVEALEKAGFTSDVIKVVEKSWVKNKDEVEAVLVDLDKAAELRTEVQDLGAKTVEMKHSVRSSEIKLQKIDKKLATKKNQLDSEEAKIIALKKVVKVVEAGLRRGYTPEEMIGIFILLEMLEIQKQPGLSIMRLVESIGVAKNLSTLKIEIAGSEKRLEQLNQLEDEIKSRIELLNAHCLKGIADETAAGREALNFVAAQAKVGVREIITELETKTQLANEAAAANLLKEAKLEQVKNSLAPLTCLLGLAPDVDMAKTVTPSLVIDLLENLQHWLDLKFPNAMTRGFYDPSVCKFVLNPNGYPTQLVDLLASVSAGLYDSIMKENMNKTIGGK